MNNRLSMIKPIMKDVILLRLVVFEECLNNRIIFFPIANDKNKVDNINPIKKINSPKADIDKPTIVIADNGIISTNTIIKRNPTRVFFIIDFDMARYTISN